MPKQLADDWQPEGSACAHARERMPKVMDAHVVQPGRFCHRGPRPLQIGTGLPRFLTRDDMRIAFNTGRVERIASAAALR